MKTIKKIFAICAIGMFALGGLAGCTKTYTQDEVTQMLETAKATAYETGASDTQSIVDDAVQKAINEYKSSDEIATLKETAENANNELETASDEIDRLKAVLQDYEEAEQEIEAEQNFVLGSEEINLNLGDSFSSKTYDDGDINKLLDTSIEFNGEDYDIHEEVSTNSYLKVAYSLIDDEEFEATPYIITNDEGAIVYKFVFDDVIDTTEISRDEPLKIKFLGSDMTITKVNSSEFEIKSGNSQYMLVGSQISVGDNTIILNSVTEDGNSAGLVINGQLHWIDVSDSVEFDDFTIAVDDVKVIHSNGNDASVEVSITETSDDVYKTFKDGDSVIYDEDVDDAEFIYKIDVDAISDNLVSLAVEHNQKMDELDDDFTPLKEGDSITFPNGYISLKFDSTNVDSYETINVEFDDVENADGVEYYGIIFSASDKVFEIASDESSEVYAYTLDDGDTWKLSFLNDDSDVVDTTNTSFNIVFEDNDYIVSYYNTTKGIVQIGKDGYEYLSFDPEIDATGNFTHLGDNKEEADENDVVLDGTPIGTEDNDILGIDGIIVKQPEDNADDDVIEFLVPEDTLEITTYLG